MKKTFRVLHGNEENTPCLILGGEETFRTLFGDKENILCLILSVKKRSASYSAAKNVPFKRSPKSLSRLSARREVGHAPLFFSFPKDFVNDEKKDRGRRDASREVGNRLGIKRRFRAEKMRK